MDWTTGTALEEQDESGFPFHNIVFRTETVRRAHFDRRHTPIPKILWSHCLAEPPDIFEKYLSRIDPCQYVNPCLRASYANHKAFLGLLLP